MNLKIHEIMQAQFGRDYNSLESLFMHPKDVQILLYQAYIQGMEAGGDIAMKSMDKSFKQVGVGVHDENS